MSKTIRVEEAKRSTSLAVANWAVAAISVLRQEHGFTAEQANAWLKRVTQVAAERYVKQSQNGTQPDKVTGGQEG